MIVVPVYNKMILPYSRIYFRTDEFKSLSGRVAIGEKVVMLVKKEDTPKEEYKEDSFYPLGVTGNISSIGAEGYVEVSAGERVFIDDISINQDYSIELSIRRNPVTIDISEEIRANKLDKIRKEMNEYVSNYSWGQNAKAFISQFRSLEEAICALSIWMTITNEEQYSLLEIDSLKKRTEEIERMLYEYIEVAKVSSDASFAQQEEYQNMYKESAIKKQMEFLQKELDELHPEKVTDVRKFEMKIDNAGMNETAEAEARKVLNRLKQEGSQSSETGMLYDYLDFVTSLSWKSEDPKNIDLDYASKVLDEDHYGLKKVKKRIIQQIAVMNLKKKQSGSILLFVGAPGTGKTSIGKSIARALGREYSRVSLGGARDEADIRGHRRTYIGAMPGRIMDGIQKSGVSNPVMVLDEVDKIGASYHGDPASALLEVLDPEQNSTFTDHYMNVPYDLSDVFFICTANTTDTIPGPLLDRMEVIHFEGYTPLEKLSIAKEHLLPKAMEKMGIPEGKINISDDMINTIISEYTREAGVRGLRKRMDTLCRGAAVQIAKNPDATFEVTKEGLRDELDMRPVHRENVPDKQKSGVVTGLAWTSVGGEILYIETVFTRGRGNIIITGQLGDVMKESAQIAVSLVKTMFPDKASMFSKNDIHIHVPEGAVPKDGPSAGITLTTAIASLVTGKAVDPHFAMTGEVSLRGVISPIGGLPEKLMAAQRAGVKTVFIPKENEDDLRDVASEVLEQIEVIPVSSVEQVLDKVGIELDKKNRKINAA